MTFLRAASCLALVFLLPSCAEEPSRAEPDPTASPTASAATPSPPEPRVVTRAPRADVPDVTGRSLERAVRLLQAEGLAPYWSLRTGEGDCGAPPVVTSQRTPSGPARYGDAVGLEVRQGRCPLTDDRRATADAFVEFARGGPPPPITSPVVILVGHEVVAVLPPGRSPATRAWRGCPASGSYAAAICPFDLLRPFSTGDVVVATAPPAHPCLHHARLAPSGLDDLRSVTVAHEGSCVDSASVQLYVDDGGLVVAADLVLPEP